MPASETGRPVKIRYFAWLRNRVGHSEEAVDLPPEVTSVKTLTAFLAARHAGFAEALQAKGVVRCAVNQEYVAEDGPVRGGDEVGFFPPVTGG